MKKPIFTGASCAIITPFDESGVNLKEFAKILDYQIENGTDSITVCGTTGESATLSMFEMQELISFCISHVAGKVPIIAGIGGNNTKTALELAKFASNEGANGLLAVTPYYNKTSQDGLIKHFSVLADATKTPIVLYNVPSRTSMNISVDTYVTLSKHENINGTKDASGDFSALAEIISLCGENLNIWSGNDDMIIPTTAIGGKGVISVFSNIAPKICSMIANLSLDGDYSTANRFNRQYLPLIKELFSDVNPIPIKSAMEILGFKTGGVRMPLVDMKDMKNLELLIRNAHIKL